MCTWEGRCYENQPGRCFRNWRLLPPSQGQEDLRLFERRYIILLKCIHTTETLSFRLSDFYAQGRILNDTPRKVKKKKKKSNTEMECCKVKDIKLEGAYFSNRKKKYRFFCVDWNHHVILEFVVDLLLYLIIDFIDFLILFVYLFYFIFNYVFILFYFGGSVGDWATHTWRHNIFPKKTKICRRVNV